MIRVINILDDFRKITSEAVASIKNADSVFVQSGKIACKDELEKYNSNLYYLDDLFEQSSDYDELKKNVANYIVEKSMGKESVFLCLGGIKENAIISALYKSADTECLPSVSLGDVCLAYAKKYFDTSTVLSVPFSNLADSEFTGYEAVLVTNISNKIEMSEVKLKLSEFAGDNFDVIVTDNNQSRKFGIIDIDRIDLSGNESCVFMPQISYENRERYSMNDLQKIMRRLRGRNGCPWDREQTHESIRKNVLEEAEEVAEAIDMGNPEHLYDELGDLLLQVVFHAVIAEEEGSFNMGDVTTAICAKLIRRHPHIFADLKADTADDVLKIWQAVKATEKNNC